MNPPPKCPFCNDTRLVRFEQPSPPGYLLVPCPKCLPWLQGPAGESRVHGKRDLWNTSEDSGLTHDTP